MEKVEKKQEKRDSHARWKARMWGGAADKGRSTVVLPSESTDRGNVGGSLGLRSMEKELKNGVFCKRIYLICRTWIYSNLRGSLNFFLKMFK